jgi:hypothetical protein
VIDRRSVERYERLITFGELEIIGEETIVAYFKILSQHSSEGAVEIHEKQVKIFGTLAEIRIGATRIQVKRFTTELQDQW